jgi:hypothetical protein
MAATTHKNPVQSVPFDTRKAAEQFVRLVKHEGREVLGMARRGGRFVVDLADQVSPSKFLKDTVLKNPLKTKLDLLLDKVVAGKSELTLDVRDYTQEQKDRVEAAAEARGLHVSSDGKHILIRDMRSSNPITSASQYGLMEAIAHGTSASGSSITKAQAREMIAKTPHKDRQRFAGELIGGGRINPRINLVSEDEYDWNSEEATKFLDSLNDKQLSKRLRLVQSQQQIAYEKGLVEALNNLQQHEEAIIQSRLRKFTKARRRNPEDSAASMYESFHGKPSTEMVEFAEDVHYHENLSGLGVLVELKVVTQSGYDVTLCFESGEGDELKNPFGFSFGGGSKKTTYSSKLIEGAYRLGYRGSSGGGRGDIYFEEWLEKQKPETLSSSLKSKLKDEYFKGMKDYEQHTAALPMLRQRLKEEDRSSRSSRSSGRSSGGSKKKSVSYKGHSIKESDGEWSVPSIDDGTFNSLKEAKEYVDYYKLGMRATKNPDSQNISPETVVLCSNEDGTQLYFVGGDQGLDLKSIHMDGDWERDSMVIGCLYELTYHTEKKFDKFKPTSYFHKLGEDTGDQPMLLYDRMNQRLSVSGGQYKINKPLIGMSPGIEN